MKRRIALVSLSVLLLLITGLAGGLAWLGLSEAGLQWSYRQLQREIPAEFSVTGLKGRLLGRVQISGLEYRSPQIEYEVDEIELDAQLSSLLFGHIDIRQLSLRKLMLRLPAESDLRTGYCSCQPSICPGALACIDCWSMI